METFPIYALAYQHDIAPIEISPVFESPLGLFSGTDISELIQKDYGIDKRYLNNIMSPWALKRLKQSEGDISNFRVVRLQPSKLEQIAVMKTEPGDETIKTSLRW